MSRLKKARGRSTAEWSVRGISAFIVAVLGCLSVSHAFGYMLRTADAERAHALAPWDGRVTAALARTYADIDATPANRRTADRFALTALRQDPTAVVAVSTLGIDAHVRGDITRARRLFGYAERLSRRDFQTQLWALEDAVGRGDIDGALRHYDIALRTTRNAPEILFPVLALAIADPAIRAALVRTLAARPSWGTSFTEYAAGEGSDPRAMASLLLMLRRAKTPVSELASAAVVNALVTKRYPDAAWAYYATVRFGVDRRISRDPRFMADLVHPSPFDWAPINDAGTVTSIQRGADGGVVDFSAPSGIGGPLLQQMQVLPPGRYRLRGHTTDIDQPAESSPYWLLACREGRELGRVAIPNSTTANGNFGGVFDVPVDCPVQMLMLLARPSSAIGGVSGQIDLIRLSPR